MQRDTIYIVLTEGLYLQGISRTLRALQCVQGTITGLEHSYQLDDHHTFVKGKPMLVCGNTAAMVGEKGVSWLAKNFQVSFCSM